MKYDVCVFGGCSLDMMFYQKPDGTYEENPEIIVLEGKALIRLLLLLELELKQQ